MSSLGFMSDEELEERKTCEKAGLMHCQGIGVLRHRQFASSCRTFGAIIIAVGFYLAGCYMIENWKISVDYFLGVTRPYEWRDVIKELFPFFAIVEGFWYFITAGMGD